MASGAGLSCQTTAERPHESAAAVLALVAAPAKHLRLIGHSWGGEDLMADLGAPHTAEKFLCPIRASEAVCLFMIDTLHFEAAMKLIPIGRFVGAMWCLGLRNSIAIPLPHERIHNL